MRIQGGCHCGKVSYCQTLSEVWCSSALPWSTDLGAVKQHPKNAG